MNLYRGALEKDTETEGLQLDENICRKGVEAVFSDETLGKY